MDWDEEVPSQEDQEVEQESHSNEPETANNKKRKRPPSGNTLDPEAKRLKRKEMKQKKLELKLRKPNAKLVADLFKQWEVFRNSTLDMETRMKSLETTMEMLQGKVKEIVFKSKASRVVQTIIKIGKDTHRGQIFDEIKDCILDLAKNHYGQFVLTKMLKYGSKEQRDYIISKFYGNVVKLTKHSDAAKVIEYAYANACTPVQQAALVEEFYGSEFALFKSDKKRTLKTILEENPDKRSHIFRYLKERLTIILNKADNSALLNNTILHTPFLNYFELADVKDRQDMITRLSEHVIRMIHTKPGSKVGWYCVSYGTAKDRKTIVKSMKSYCTKISKEEYAHLVLLRILECVDDTVLINKIITSELRRDLADLCKDKHGRVAILNLLSPHDTRYLPPPVLQLLEPATIPDPENPGVQIPTSKKDPEQRRMEILKPLLPDLYELCKQRTFTLITNVYGRDVLFQTIKYASTTDDPVKGELFNAVLKLVGYSASDKEKERKYSKKKFHALDFMQEKEEKEDIMTHSLAHRTLRVMVSEIEGFGELLFNRIKDQITTYATKAFAGWVVLSLLELDATKDKVIQLLKPITATLEESKKDNFAASSILKHLTESQG